MMKETMKGRLMPYRLLAALLALILAGGVIWYGAILVLAAGSGVQLQDLSGDRSAMQGVTLAGVVEDGTWKIDFTVTEKRTQNNFVPLDGRNNIISGTPFYYSVTPVPAPGADTSEPELVTDAGGTQHYAIDTDEIAYYINVWGEQGRELVLFDTGIRCHTDEGRYFFESTSRYIGDEGGHRMWLLRHPTEEHDTPANQDAYWQAHDLAYTIDRTRTERYDLVMISVGNETKVYRIDRWGSTLDIKETTDGTGCAFTDYTQPVGGVSETATLPGVLRRAGQTTADTAVALIQNEQGLAACALDEAGFLTDQALVLPAGEAGEPCNALVVTATIGTGFADIGLLLEPNGPAAAANNLVYPAGTAETAMLAAEAELNSEPHDTCPWAAALRVEDGRFTVVERLPLTAAGNASRFLAAGLDKTGEHLVTVQQLKPLREEQPPAGVMRNFHLAGEVSTAVWQAGEKLYEGILNGSWREDIWRRAFMWDEPGMTERYLTFGENDLYGGDHTSAYGAFYQADGEVEYR